MELRMSLPFPVTRSTVTALSNIYLLLSVFVIQAIATERPDKLISHHTNDSDHHSDLMRVSSQSKHDNLERRSLDSYYYYEDDNFSPSVRFESEKQRPSVHNSHTSGHQRPAQRYSDFRPGRNQSPRERKYDVPRDSPVSRGAGYSSRPQRRPAAAAAGDRDVYYAQRQKPFRRQSSAERVRPLHQPQLFDYEDFDYDFGPPEPTRKRPESLISNFMNLLRPNKRKSIKPEPSLNEPSLEWLYNDIPDEKDELFFPNNADYDEGNIDLRDPVYDFKDVLHSIRNNESRIVTLKKFLSAASGFSDKAGTDPVTALSSMPLTILSILGAFYAVSAIGVLGYKYTLFTAGSTNGQAVALLPVAILFLVPLVAAIAFVVTRSSIDGKISLSRLARGDGNWLRPDFDSVDFMYDVGVGATALLGLGWVVSVAL